MKRKSQIVTSFLEDLHKFILQDRQTRKKTNDLSEREMQREIAPIIISFLENYFLKAGYKDPKRKAHNSFYWEGQEKNINLEKSNVFASRNYPDFYITDPYKVSIEYKKGDSGSLIKHGIGQALIQTISEEYDFAYFLFYDESKDSKIAKSIKNKYEINIIEKMWEEFNVKIKIFCKGDLK